MDAEGPPLELLVRRLAETPEDFLAEPKIGSAGTIGTAAVAHDLAKLLGGSLDRKDLDKIAGMKAPAARVALLLCWLLGEEWFRQHGLAVNSVLALLTDDSDELAGQTPAPQFVLDPERREEIARLTLSRLGFRPAGETKAQAQDRLTSLSATERARVMKAARAAEERAREIREALAKKAADEAADKWTRE